MGRLFTFAMHISIEIIDRSLFYYPSGTLLFITIVVSHWLNSLFAISELLLTLYFFTFYVFFSYLRVLRTVMN